MLKIVRAAKQWEQCTGNAGLNRRSHHLDFGLYHIRRDDEVQMLAISAPSRPDRRCALRRDLSFVAGAFRKWSDVDLYGSRFVRLIRYPFAIRRNLGQSFIGVGL